MPSYLQIENISKSYGPKVLFEHIGFNINEGDKIALIAPNGTGKTSLLRILAGKDSSDSGGKILFLRDIRIAFLEQEYEYDPESTVWDQIMRDSEQWTKNLDPEHLAEYEQRVRRLLTSFGMSEYDRKMKVLSGGEIKRAAIIVMLASEADFFVMDEPTNHLDIDAIAWLEDFLSEYFGTVIVVSHDRHFLNDVCTHIVDIDYTKIKMYVGNYEFWYESSQMMQRLIKQQNKKVEDKIAELKTFIARFSANKSKSKQATSRRKLLDNLTVEELPASSRRYPFIGFDMDRELGKEVLQVSGISKTVDGVKLLNNVSFTLGRTDKVAFIGESEQAITMLFKILMEEETPDEGTFKWGVSTSTSYFPVDNSAYFNDNDDSILDWIRQYSTADETETFLRGFLGRMLFSGDDIYKPVKVLSGGEKVRCMFARMMLFHSNVLLLDRPTNHLDLESITAVNNGLVNFKGVVILSSHDHEILETVANRIIEITPDGCIDRQGTYEEYLAWKKENGK